MQLEVDTHQLIARAARELMSLPPEQIDDSVRAGLQAIAERIGVQRGYVFLLTDDGSALAGAMEWCAPGVLEHDFEAFRGVPVTAFPWTMEQLRARQTIVVQDPDALGEEAAPERGSCEAMDINDYVNTALVAEGRLLGWLGFDSVRTRRQWSGRDVHLVEAAADVLAAALSRKRRDLIVQREREMNNRAAAIGTLAAGLAHEINNPLTYVMGNLAYIEEWLIRPENAAPADMQEVFADTREGAERIKRIVKDLRGFARGSEVDVGPVDLVEVLDSTLRMVSSQLQDTAAVVRRYQGAPPVLAAASQLSQVLLNLLLNAAQAMKDGRPAQDRVTITAAADGQEVEIRIEDTGKGIDAETLPRIFDPFFTTRDVGRGMGVGLSISRRIVSQLGGTLSAQSTPGQGTTMIIRLPRAPEQHREEHPVTVLVIDDEVVMLRWLKRVLSSYRVLTTSSGEQALQILRRERVDVILCDLMMPEVSGMDLYNTLAAEQPEAARGMIFITGGAFTDDTQRFLDTVPNRRLIKPFDAGDVATLLDEAEARLIS